MARNCESQTGPSDRSIYLASAFSLHASEGIKRKHFILAAAKAGIEIDDITATGALLEKRLPTPCPPSLSDNRVST